MTILKFGKKRHKEDDRKLQEDAAKLEQFEVKELLGRGGFAVVHAAHKKGQAADIKIAMRVVPLKSILTGPTIFTVEQMRERLEWVKDLHRNNPCPFVLAPIDYCFTHTDLITFTELCSGGDLFDRICNSPDGHFTEEDAQDATRSLCSAVAWAHAIGTAHRDIKPENVLYRRKDSKAGELYLMDFGCAIPQTPRNKLHRGIAGTPGYMAPEMLSPASPGYTVTIDEWSVGICVYEMLTGRSPLLSETPEALIEETLSRNVPWPRQYWEKHSPSAKHFVQRLLQKDPSKRMTVEEALESGWLKGLPGPERHDSTSSLETSYSIPPLALRKTLKTMRTQNSSSAPDLALGAVTGGLDSQEHDVVEFDTTAVLAGGIKSMRLAALQTINSDISVSTDGSLESK